MVMNNQRSGSKSHPADSASANSASPDPGTSNISLSFSAQNQGLIDWLAFTVKETDPQRAITLCGLDVLPFQSPRSGNKNYQKSIRAGNIMVYFNGFKNMGCHFEFTGEGCRQFERLNSGEDNLWHMLLRRLSSINVNFTRIDLAIDNVDGKLDLDLLEDCLEKDAYLGGFRVFDTYKRRFREKRQKEKPGKTVTLGSPTSDQMIRFYDKAAQQKISTHWVRCEVQLRHKHAAAAIRHPPGWERVRPSCCCHPEWFFPSRERRINQQGAVQQPGVVAGLAHHD